MHITTKVFIGVDIVAMVLVILPFSWQWQARNTATCYMIIFSLLGCTTHLINGILWADGLEDIAPVWCDISTKINIGLSVGLPLASLSINRRLCHNANSFTASSMSSRRRDMIIDTVVCVGGTLVFMAVHYTQQGHRYNILERFGCWPTTYLTELGWAFVVAPPILISLISCGYCLFAISGFMKRRQEFNEHFQKGCDDNHAINYIRLMLLSMCELTFGLPCTVFFFVAAFVASVKRKTIYHWISWEDTHFNFSRVERITLYMSRQGGAFVVPSYDISRFAFPITALMFFVFFGFSSQAYQSYYEAYAWIAFKVFGKSLPRWNDRGQGSRNRSVFKLPLFNYTIAVFHKDVNPFKEDLEATISEPDHVLDGFDHAKRFPRRDSDGLSVVSYASWELKSPDAETFECHEMQDFGSTSASARKHLSLLDALDSPTTPSGSAPCSTHHRGAASSDTLATVVALSTDHKGKGKAAAPRSLSIGTSLHLSDEDYASFAAMSPTSTCVTVTSPTASKHET